MLKGIKKHLLAVLIAALVVTAGVATACGGGEQTLSTPANVRLEAKVLVWNPVENAEGYTVKINQTEVTVNSGTGYDLTTASAIEKLTNGVNSLSVKANAHGDWLESAYSAVVSYTYTPEASVTKLDTPSITLDEANKKIKWTAVANASGYTLKAGTAEVQLGSEATEYDLTSAEAKELFAVGTEVSVSLKAKGTGSYSDSNFSNVVKYTRTATNDEIAQEFIAAVNNIDAPVTLNSKAKIASAKTKYNAIKANSAVLAVAGVSDAVDTLKTKDAAYYGLLVEAVDTITENSTLAQITATESAMTAAEDYYATIFDETAAATHKAYFDAKATAYENVTTALKTKVDTLIDGLKTATTEAADLTGKNKAELAGYHDAINEKLEAIGDIDNEYQTHYLTNNSEHQAAITAASAKIEEILAIAVESSISYSPYFINRDHGGNGKIFAVLTVKNCKDELIGGNVADAPILTVGNVEDTNRENVIYNADKKCYVYEIAFACPADGDDPLTLTYKIGDGEPISKTIYRPTGTTGVFTNGAGDKLIVTEGGITKLAYAGAETGKTVYADVYAEGDIYTQGSNTVSARDVDIFVKASPLGTVEIKNDANKDFMSADALKRAIAKQDIIGENLKLRLVLYTLEKDGEDEHYSSINSASVSEILPFGSITEADKKEMLPMGVSGHQIMADGGFEIGGAFLENDLVSTFNSYTEVEGAAAITKDTVRNYLKYHVYIFKNGVEVTDGDFYTDIPGNGWITKDILILNVAKACGETTENDTITLKVAITLKENSPFDKYLRESSTVSVDWNYTVSEDDNKELIDFKIGNAGMGLNGDAIETDAEGNISFGSGAITTVANQFNRIAETKKFTIDNVVNYLRFKVKVTPQEGGETKYVYVDYTNWMQFKAADLKYQIYLAMGASETGSAGYTIAFSIELRDPAAYTEKNPALAAELTELAEVLKGSEETPEYKWNHIVTDGDAAPTDKLQLGIEDSALNFVRTNQPINAAGSIFDKEYGVTYIEIQFKIGESGTVYSAYMFKEGEDVVIYKDTEKSGTALVTEGKYTNAYAFDSAVNDWVNAQGYTDLTDFAVANAYFRTKIYHNNTYYKTAAQYSEWINRT